MSRACEAVLSLSAFSTYSASLMSASRKAICAATKYDQSGSRMLEGYESSSPGLPSVPAPRPRSAAAGGTKTAFEVMCLAERVCVDAQSSASAARRDAAEMCRMVSVLRSRLDSLERAGGSVEVLERVAQDLESRITRGQGDVSVTCSSISALENQQRGTPGERDALGHRVSVASWRGRVDTSSSHLPSLSPSSSPPSRLHTQPHASPTVLQDNPPAQRGDADADAAARRSLEAEWDAKSIGVGVGGGGGGSGGGVPLAASPLEWDAGSVSGVPQASPLEISGIGGSSVVGRIRPLMEAGPSTEDDSLLSYLVVAGTGSSFDEGAAH